MDSKRGIMPWLLREVASRELDLSDEEGAESGFTLIELMVVLLIMAILLAIAIPTFLGVKSSAQDRSAQSDLTNAITSAKAVYTQNGAYPTGPAGQTGVSMATSLQTVEPELTFTTLAVQSSGTPHGISVTVDSQGLVLVLADVSADSRCWMAEDNENAYGTPTIGGLSTSIYTTQNGIHYAGSPSGTACTSIQASSPQTAYAGFANTVWYPSYPA
jgi:type IV pilus assembly protein PilA